MRKRTYGNCSLVPDRASLAILAQERKDTAAAQVDEMWNSPSDAAVAFGAGAVVGALVW